MYEMPVKSIKSILKRELQAHRDSLYKLAFNDIHRGMIDLSFKALNTILCECENYPQIGNYLDEAGYRMSLEDWINSL